MLANFVVWFAISKEQGMAKQRVTGIRQPPEEQQALQRAAAAEDRSVSWIGRNILAEWLRANGWLKQGAE